jgi:hypothetical protein
MKRILASLLTFVLLLSLFAMSSAEEYDTFTFGNYSYKVPSGWIQHEINNYQLKVDGEEISDTCDLKRHFPKEEGNVSGGTIVAITGYVNSDMSNLKDDDAVIEDWVAVIVRTDRMKVEKIEKLPIGNTNALLYSGYYENNMDRDNLPFSLTVWKNLDVLYAMLYTNSDYSIEQIIAFTRTLLSHVEYMPVE